MFQLSELAQEFIDGKCHRNLNSLPLIDLFALEIRMIARESQRVVISS